MKLFRDCPLLVGIGATAIILSVMSMALKDTVYADIGGGAEGPDEPAIARVFKAASMGIYPWSSGKEPDESFSIEEVPQAEEQTPVDESPEEASSQDLQQEDADISGNSSFDISGNSSGYDISGNSAEEPVYEFTDVDDDYFTDALFIGDSRTVGLSEYCEALDTRATFYAKVSLTIYDCMSKEFIKTDDGKINVETALEQQQFGKIYIMLGINEIGTGNAEYFKEAYSGVIDRIRELQPDAIIYIQGIMHVTEDKSSKDKYFTNENINERNEAISQLANNRDIFYLDMNEVVDDGNGNLDRSLSFDDVHLKASSYERWHEFLLHNGIIR
ncbi:MAG: acylhydrolase [Butyrivibrio sp.]|nr:acylhydrolase [Butyrivibrio sp.]